MANSVQTSPRADLDIREDISELFITYGPMMHDRHRVHVSVTDGNVVIHGHIKSRVTYTFLINSVPLVRGVKSLDTSELYCDETIRFDVGQKIPHGVFVNVEYGAVILSGKLPTDTVIEDLVKQVASVPGVHRVLTSFVN